VTLVPFTKYRVSRPISSLATVVSELIGPELCGKPTDEAPPTNGTWVVLLCLNASIALCLIAAGHGAGRRGEVAAPIFFWSGIVLLLLPITSRIAWPVLARAERLFLLFLLTESLLLYKLLYAPTGFVQYDELLHWNSAHDILHRHQLFLRNSLLPVSASYPGLEILSTALANLAGLQVFPAAMLVMLVLRATFIAALFLFFEIVAQSSRLAGLACLVYMGCSNFVYFDSMFAYESLGIVLCLLALLAEADVANQTPQSSARALVLIAMLLASLAVTHHISAFACALYLVGLVAIEALRRDDQAPLRSRIGLVGVAAVLAVTFPLLWMYWRSIPVSGYIGPVVERGLADLLDKLNGGSSARHLFVAANGIEQPIGYRVIGVASTALLVLGLATGFFRSLALTAGTSSTSGWGRLQQLPKRRWRNSRVVLLTLAAFGFPASVAFRLTGSGWELGYRMSAFVFVAVGLVVAVSIVHFWQLRRTRWRLIVISLAIATLVLGDITTGSGGHAIRGGYRVAADAESIEPMGIEAAMWTRSWLGEGNRFAADRVNRTLLGTYGQQDVVTTIADGVDASRIFFAESLSPETLYPIRKGRIDYLLVDLRITTATPALGEYFEENDANRGVPPSPSRLLKFDNADRVTRIYDNGWIVIFDVRALHGRE
jgi:hypothetical protein